MTPSLSERYADFRRKVDVAACVPYRVPGLSELMPSMRGVPGYLEAFQAAERLRYLLDCDLMHLVLNRLEAVGRAAGGLAVRAVKTDPRYMAVSLMTSPMPLTISLEFSGDDRAEWIAMPALVVRKLGPSYVIENTPRADMPVDGAGLCQLMRA